MEAEIGRYKLQPLNDGKLHVFTATKNDKTKVNRILLTNIKLRNAHKVITDHVWVEHQMFFDDIPEGTSIRFKARVRLYLKHGFSELDCTLENVQNVEEVEETNSKMKIDDDIELMIKYLQNDCIHEPRTSEYILYFRIDDYVRLAGLIKKSVKYLDEYAVVQYLRQAVGIFNSQWKKVKKENRASENSYRGFIDFERFFNNIGKVKVEKLSIEDVEAWYSKLDYQRYTWKRDLVEKSFHVKYL